MCCVWELFLVCVFVVVATQNNPSNHSSQKAASDLAGFLHYVNNLRSKHLVFPFLLAMHASSVPLVTATCLVLFQIVGQWEFIRFGTKPEQHQLRSKQDLDDLEKQIDSVKKPSKTAVKIYLDSVLDFDTDVRRGSLFDEWEDEVLAQFVVSDSSKGHSIESDPLNEKAPAGLSGYALSAYEELKEAAKSDDDEAEIALEALKLLTEFAGGNK